MKRLIMGIAVLMILALAHDAYAELQSVAVGGGIRIRGRHWNNSFVGGMFNPYSPTRVRGRAVGPYGVSNLFDWGGKRDHTFVEERTVLSVKADFTDDVAVFVEFDSYEVWGEDFRSANYLTGVDTRANSSNDVEVYQSYVELKNLFGQPLRMRVGRQAMKYGKGWLYGDSAGPTKGISYDGVRFTYDVDDFTVDASWAKLAENMGSFGDGDIDLFALYGTYKGIEELGISLYWFYVRDDIIPDDSPGWHPLQTLFEEMSGLNDYDTTHLHTVGTRFFGSAGGFDYDWEVAYQFGEADAAGSLFRLNGYGDDGAKFGAWATDLEVGYAFDFKCQPRLYVGGAWFEGDDHRDRSFWEYLNPFYRPEASVGFNRLTSAKAYSLTWDLKGGSRGLANFYSVRTGVSASVTESVSTGLNMAYFWADETWDKPVGLVSSLFPWWTKESDDDLALICHLWVKYAYSEDLWIRVGWERVFPGGGMRDGNYNLRNGLISGGMGDDPGDYVYFDTGISF